MQLVLLRHGIAEMAEPGQDDADRALTARGRRRTRQAVAGLVRWLDPASVIYASPKVRAWQTAQMLAALLEVQSQTLEVLADANPRPLARWIRRMDETSVVLVGHEPQLSQLVSLLCAGSPGRMGLALKKAGVAMLRREATGPRQTWTLEALLPPRLLRRSGSD